MKPIYDNIGINYSVRRCTDPKIAKQLYAELHGATRIVNIGAGTGSYEPENVDLVAVEPSAEMISQRKVGSHPVEKAFAEKLPFENSSFSHTMTVLSSGSFGVTLLPIQLLPKRMPFQRDRQRCVAHLQKVQIPEAPLARLVADVERGQRGDDFATAL